MKKHLDFLNLLSKTHPFQQRALLETDEPDQVCAICECIYNIMHGNIPVPEGIKEELPPRRQMLRDLADTKVLKNKERNTLTEWKFNLGALITPVISSVLGFIKNSKK